MINSPLCSCGPDETVEHYFFDCLKNNQERRILLEQLAFLQIVNIDTLLFGDNNLSYDDNIKLFDAVHMFIRSIKRFD